MSPSTCLTHDAAGGNSKIKALVPGIHIYGGKGDQAEAVDTEVGQGDSFSVGQLQVDVLFTPCHTPGGHMQSRGQLFTSLSEQGMFATLWTGQTCLLATRYLWAAAGISTEARQHRWLPHSPSWAIYLQRHAHGSGTSKQNAQFH